MNNIFSEKAWEDYTDWQMKDKSMIKKINELIKEIITSEEDLQWTMKK